MKTLTKLFAIAAALASVAACGSANKSVSGKQGFPSIDQGGKTAIVAHRGFWKSAQGGMSENSIASLKAAQDAGLWGSECDIHLTADGKVIVNHNKDINGKKISEHNFADFAGDLLPNGERRPSLDEYLDQAAKCKTTKLIIELKKQPTQEIETKLVDETIKALKAHKLYTPDRVLFISFSEYMCKLIASDHPQFTNQFLTSDKVKDMSPSKYSALKINGIDYETGLFKLHPDWVDAAHKLGMSVNVWTVNEAADIKRMIELGVDAITTNEPLRVRELLGEKEYKKAR